MYGEDAHLEMDYEDRFVAEDDHEDLMDFYLDSDEDIAEVYGA